ncbi:MAG: phosphatidate cytidylyltransferase [Neisseria sp.]|nr:phosphatidate cytidylyltransferase [Neisseria sp.]
MNEWDLTVAQGGWPPAAGYIFLGVFAVLLLASVIGQALKRRYGADNAVVGNLNARIYAWWLMIFVLLLAFGLGRVGTTLLFCLISFAAMREFMTLVYRRFTDYNSMIACFYVLLPLQYYFVLDQWYGMFSIFIPVYGFLLLSIVAGLSGDTGAFLERTAKTQWMAMACIFCLSHVPALLFLELDGFARENNILLLIFMIIVVQASDVLQYVWGKLLGGRKIMPGLSPSKTVSGTVGGIVSATLLAALLAPITPFGVWQAAATGLIVCLSGFAGGLVMSAIKRSYGVKDWGKMISGHGGMLDRVDSVCFAAPVFFHIVRYFWHG